jgi:hypothetical protein
LQEPEQLGLKTRPRYPAGTRSPTLQIKDFFDQQQELFNKLERVLNDGKLPEQQQGEINLILDALRVRNF